MNGFVSKLREQITDNKHDNRNKLTTFRTWSQKSSSSIEPGAKCVAPGGSSNYDAVGSLGCLNCESCAASLAGNQPGVGNNSSVPLQDFVSSAVASSVVPSFPTRTDSTPTHVNLPAKQGAATTGQNSNSVYVKGLCSDNYSGLKGFKGLVAKAIEDPVALSAVSEPVVDTGLPRSIDSKDPSSGGCGGLPLVSCIEEGIADFTFS